jgi:hypothetical protein
MMYIRAILGVVFILATAMGMIKLIIDAFVNPMVLFPFAVAASGFTAYFLIFYNTKQ